MYELGQPQELPSFSDVIAHVRLNQVCELFRARRDGPQEESDIRQLVLVWRLLQHLDHLGVRRRFLARLVVELQRAQQLTVGYHQAIGERKLRVDHRMPEDHVGELVRKHCRQARFVRQHVDQPAADHDRVAEGERLERRRQQDAAPHRRLDGDPVCHLEVVHDRLEHFVDVAGWREQSALVEALEHVLFRFLFPSALAHDGRELARLIRGIAHGGLVDPDRRELSLRLHAFGLVPPQSHLRLDAWQLYFGLVVVRICFLAVHVRRQPESGQDVYAPAIHMKRELLPKEGRQRLIDVAADAVEAHDVVVAILDPDAARESVADVVLRFHVEHDASRFADEFPADVLEVVSLPIEQVPVGYAHRGKAVGQVLDGELAREKVLRSLDGAQRLELRTVLPVELTQKILVLHRDRAELVVGRQILNVDLHDRMVGLHANAQRALGAGDAIGDLFERKRILARRRLLRV